MTLKSFIKLLAKHKIAILIVFILFVALVYFARQIKAIYLEGLKSSDADKVKQALDKYVENVEKDSKLSLQQINDLIKKQGVDLSTADIMSLQGIFTSNVSNQYNSTYMMDQIAAINSDSKDLLTIVNGYMGNQYSHVLTLLKSLPDTSADDPGFEKIVSAQKKNPQVGTGLTSTYTAIKNYQSNAMN